jgi:ubiquinone/menaquinone biosynthesis C-methylase UbiE
MKNSSRTTEERFRSERSFHDAKYAGDDLYPPHYRANPTYQVYEKMVELIGDMRGKRLLEYGCGEGWTTVDFARRGALVDAFDISEQGVRNTRTRLEADGLGSECVIRQMPAENLDYPDDRFDLAVGFAILHHLDVPQALGDLHRVLKPGGRAIFAEPLGTNPLINFYRRLTPQYRTPDEAPLVLRNIEKQAAAFRTFEHHECYLTALAALAMLYVPLLNRAYAPVNRSLWKLDNWIIPKIGPLRSLCWYTVLVLTK